MNIYNSTCKFIFLNMDNWQERKERLTELRVTEVYSQKGRLGVLNPAEDKS